MRAEAGRQASARTLVPARIALAGENAGGGLALAALLTLHDSNRPLPGALLLSSPWVDLEMRGATMETNAATDPLIQKSYLQDLAAACLAGPDPGHPLVSPIHADLHALPPTLIQLGSAETLLDQAVGIAGRAGAADIGTALRIWPEMMHAWHLLFPALALLLAVERRVPEPMVDLSFVATAEFHSPLVAGAIAMFTVLALLVYFNLAGQNPTGLGLSAIGVGLFLLPLSAGLLAFAFSARSLIRSFGPRLVLTAGMLLTALASLAITVSAPAPHRSRSRHRSEIILSPSAS